MKVAIIGGGAAGLMAACELAKSGADTAVLEKHERVGRKLLATGNGRCNFTNMDISPRNYHGSIPHIDFALNAYPPGKIIEYFEKIGISARADSEGRVYPKSNQASSVLDNMRCAIRDFGGREITGFEAVSIRQKDGLTVLSKGGKAYTFDKILIATGGLAAPKLGGSASGYELVKSLGHKITKTYPSLSPLNTETEAIRGLKGQRARGTITLCDSDTPLRSENGEIMFTDYGVSGICVMQLSRYVGLAVDPYIEINLAPETSLDDIIARAGNLRARHLGDFLNGIVSKLIGQSVVRNSGLDINAFAGELRDGEIKKLFSALTGFRLKVKSVCGYDMAQVTSGGIDMRDIDIKTLESKIVSNVYVAGEICDIDGDCGGYNLNWAWASALTASHAMLNIL